MIDCAHPFRTPMNAPTPRRGLVRFGDFAVDFRSGELHKEGVKIKLPERLFLQLYLDAFLVQLSRTEINSKVAEAHEPPAWSGSIHRRSEWMGAVYHEIGRASC